MFAERFKKLHGFARAGLAIAAGGSYVGLQSAGYVDGASTDIGVDAGTVRTTVASILGILAIWYPKLQRFGVFWKSLTNHDRVEQLEATVARLEKQIAAPVKQDIPQ